MQRIGGPRCKGQVKNAVFLRWTADLGIESTYRRGEAVKRMVGGVLKGGKGIPVVDEGTSEGRIGCAISLGEWFSSAFVGRSAHTKPGFLLDSRTGVGVGVGVGVGRDGGRVVFLLNEGELMFDRRGRQGRERE
ncbi:hypothetical protein EUGRSUZ_E00021 [Eucalyptus grandis]|uniref:Uncharacterized protein n=2 Tax=Eucalyptus grandis TaxID=71139 RepID=A0ACC3KQB2_EUCGR|nr:hypothetical protein EUGRSUZ_E00021 [Eucalyptus grandis]